MQLRLNHSLGMKIKNLSEYWSQYLLNVAIVAKNVETLDASEQKDYLNISSAKLRLGK